jgi:arylsulfatase B
MEDRWRLVDGKALYDMAGDPGQKADVAGDHPEVVTRLRTAYEAYHAGVTVETEDWAETLGRPIIGSPRQPELVLCAEDWVTSSLGQCPWNQGHVARGKSAFGAWRARVARAGPFRFEVRRWPRETAAPFTGIPSGEKIPDAFLGGRPVRGTLYAENPRALPVARVRLRVNARTREAAIGGDDREAVFGMELQQGPVDIEARMLDANGRELAGAYYVYVRAAEDRTP